MWTFTGDEGAWWWLRDVRVPFRVYFDTSPVQVAPLCCLSVFCADVVRAVG